MQNVYVLNRYLMETKSRTESSFSALKSLDTIKLPFTLNKIIVAVTLETLFILAKCRQEQRQLLLDGQKTTTMEVIE